MRAYKRKNGSGLHCWPLAAALKFYWWLSIHLSKVQMIDRTRPVQKRERDRDWQNEFKEAHHQSAAHTLYTRNKHWPYKYTPHTPRVLCSQASRYRSEIFFYYYNSIFTLRCNHRLCFKAPLFCLGLHCATLAANTFYNEAHGSLLRADEKRFMAWAT